MWPFDDPDAVIQQCAEQALQKPGSDLDKYYELESCTAMKAEQLDMAELWALDSKLHDKKRQIARAQYTRSLYWGNRKGAEQAAKAYNETTEALTPAPLAAGQETVDKALEGDFGDIPGAVADGIASKYVPGYKLRKKLKKLRGKKGKKKKDKNEKNGMAVRGDCDV
jgi:hypothetical protein